MKWIASTVALVVLGVGYVTAQDLFVRLPADPPAKNPLEGNTDAITAGMGAYRQRCADCHGVDARGIRSPDITQVWAKGRTDRALFGIVRNGIPGTEMPAHPAPRTSDTDVWRILAYLKTLAAPCRPMRRLRATPVRAKLSSPETAWDATGSAIAADNSDQTSRESARRAPGRRWGGRSAARSRTSDPGTSRSR